MGTQKPNPLLDTSDLPFSVPNFKLFKPARVREAYMELLRMERKAFKDLAGRRASYKNTILGLEQASDDYHCVHSAFFHLSSVHGTPATRKLETELTQKFTQQYNKIFQDPVLFDKVSRVFNRRARLDPMAARLTETYYNLMIDYGANLSKPDQAKFRRMNTRLSKLEMLFSQRQVDEAAAKSIHLTRKDLAGLPKSLRSSMKQAAKEAGNPDGYTLLMSGDSVVRFLQYSTKRDVRERVWNVWAKLGIAGDAYDNTSLVKQIVDLRQKQAHLLGFANFSAMAMRQTMAQTPTRAMELLTSLLPPVKAAADRESDELKAFAAQDGHKGELMPWDSFFYARRHKEATANLTQQALEPYLELKQVIKAADKVAEALFGVTFTETEIPTYHNDVKLLQVTGRNGKHLGLLYTDYESRPGRKQDGAWMVELWPQDGISDTRPVLCNVLNVAKQPEGQPTFLTLDEAINLFHERGHALHCLLSQSPLPSFGGTNGPADYVEMPSQLMERFFTHPELMCKHLRHHETRKPMSKTMARAVQKHLTYRAGTQFLSRINDSILDLELYQHGHGKMDVHAFEREARTKHGLDPDYYMFPVLPVHWHIMVVYPSQFYSYIWSEALAADVFEPFKDDPLSPKLGRKLEREVMRTGISRTPEENFKALKGRDPDAGALLRHYGLI